MNAPEQMLLAALVALWLTAIMMVLSWRCLIANRRERAHHIEEIRKAFVLHNGGNRGEAADVMVRLAERSAP